MATPYYEQGTVKDYPNFNPEEDAKVLRKAMKGLGTDEKAIIDVLARRSNKQRLHIISTYKTLFGRDLIDDLKSELSGKFEDVIIALMSPLPTFLAKELHKAIAGLGTDEDTLVEILCTRSNEEIRAINQAYHQMYNTTLEKDLISDTSGHFRKLMVSMSTAGRNETTVDPERARHDAKVLFEAGEGQWGTDESTFNAILASQSYPQLRLLFHEYYQLTGRTVEQALDSELSGDIKEGMMAIAKSVQNRAEYFADKLYTAMKGLGTDDRTLIRIVVSRCEIDMVQIKQVYMEKYGKPLADAIADDISGDYKAMLVAMVEE